MIYSLEFLEEIQEEIAPMFQDAWDEVDQLADYVELDPDWDRILKLEELGIWRTYTARSEGKLVGYVCVLIDSLLHSKGHYHAATDVAYMKPEARGCFNEFLRLVEDDLKIEGVEWFTFTLKSWDKRGKFLEKKGFRLYENVYQKYIGE